MKQFAKQLLQSTASYLTPWFQARREDRLWVLMYHRILPKEDPRYAAEEPGMVVTPETFRAHLQHIKEIFTPLPLSEWISRRNANKSLPRRACAITFDDGWLDNYEFALPILKATQTPATVFAVSHLIGTNGQFWPNRITRLLLNGTEHIDSYTLRWLRQFGSIREDRVLSREEISAVIQNCKRLPDDEISAVLDNVETALGLNQSKPISLMNWDQLREMQASDLVEIGSHTCHHFRLTESLAPETMLQEISASRRLLEERLHKPATLFCYPNGDVSPSATALVRNHYGAAVTTRKGINNRNTNLHELFRIGMHEDISNTPTKFRARLSGWM